MERHISLLCPTQKHSVLSRPLPCRVGVGLTLFPLGRATLSAVKGVGASARTVRRAYYVRKLGYYQQQGAVENVAACCHTLAGYYSSIGDYNGAISLPAASRQASQGVQ
jgi:hypothetical protein